MGYYIQGPTHGKAQYIIEEHGATIITVQEAWNLINEPDIAIICVLQNGPFDAAAFCYDADEFEAFNEPTDFRCKTWLKMDRKLAKKFSGYNRE